MKKSGAAALQTIEISLGTSSGTLPGGMMMTTPTVTVTLAHPLQSSLHLLSTLRNKYVNK